MVFRDLGSTFQANFSEKTWVLEDGSFPVQETLFFLHLFRFLKQLCFGPIPFLPRAPRFFSPIQSVKSPHLPPHEKPASKLQPVNNE